MFIDQLRNSIDGKNAEDRVTKACEAFGNELTHDGVVGTFEAILAVSVIVSSISAETPPEQQSSLMLLIVGAIGEAVAFGSGASESTSELDDILGGLNIDKPKEDGSE